MRGETFILRLLVDLLIGLDFYYISVADKDCRGQPSCPVAVDRILVWTSCGPKGTRKTKRQENVNYVSSVTMRIEKNSNKI